MLQKSATLRNLDVFAVLAQQTTCAVQRKESKRKELYHSVIPYTVAVVDIHY
jgi:hypothetical protein